MQWLSENWGSLLEWAIGLLVVVGGVVGSINGEWARKIGGFVGIALAFLRRLSPTTYKDEPGSVSVPIIQGDTGEVAERVK